MKRRSILLSICAVMVLIGCGGQTTSEGPGDNPFFSEWTTPFGVPPFGEIEEEHFLPAFERAIDEWGAEVETIAANPDPPTFENTIVALDGSGLLMTRVGSVFGTRRSADTNENIQTIAKEVAPMTSKMRDDIRMNPQLFGRVKALYEQRDELALDAEQMNLLEKAYREFVRGGAELADVDKERLREINSRLSTLGLNFSDNVLAETNRFQLFIDDEADLAGLPPGVVDGAAAAASEAGREGAWLFTLHWPSYYPFLDYSANRELREQIFTAYIMRGNHDDEYDNKEILSEILELRAEKAKLLGFDTHADFILDERMAKTPEAVYQLLDDLWQPSLAVARDEAETLQEAIREDGHRLYGIDFTERHDIPTYHPEVRTFEVTDADGSHLGVFLADYYPRPGKRGGAWSSDIRGQWVQDGEEIRPVVLNVGNFSRPAGELPALLSLDEVHTLFHELGHALHTLLSDLRYRGSADVKWDFVELPSQIMENWLLEPEVLKLYAKHYQTGEVIPDELVEKIRASEQFNQGFASVEYLAACYLDMDWHTLEDPAGVDVNEFEKASMDRIGLIPEIVVRYRSPYFSHIIGGYSAGYYSYIWAEVLDADAFEAFKETSLFDQETARSFRTNILAKGGSEDPEVLYVRFRGRKPSVEPLLRKRGLK
ncbi:MAG: M3 family metallopeptidase [Acidobacteriota bacterium]